jgi:hypothetical protein
MYIYQHRCFYDKSGIPWVRGTAIALLPFPQHAGFIDYTANGEQVILHKSKQRGRAVVTWPEEFDEGHIPYQVIRVPDADQQANEWLRAAYAEIERGSAWSVFDNCQDFVWRPITGHNGSPTRDSVLGVAAVAALCWCLLG